MTTTTEAIDRLKSYTFQVQGEKIIDLLEVMADVIALLKLQGRDKQEFLTGLSALWDDLVVEQERLQ